VETLVVERGAFDLEGAFAGVAARVVGVKKCEGDANVVMIRGKPRHGFDFETTLEWRASFGETGGEDEDEDEDAVEVRGTIHIPEFSRDCAEDEACGFEIHVENRRKEHRAREDACYATLKKRGEAFIVGVLRQIDDELCERASR
jgi:activator of HSP90 ATPase